MDDLAVRMVERIVRNAVKVMFDRHGEDLELIGVHEFQVMEECLDVAMGRYHGPKERSEEELMKVDAYALRRTFQDLFQHLSDRLSAYEKTEQDVLKYTLSKPIVFQQDKP